MNEQKIAVTSCGRNKNHDDEIKKNQEKAQNRPSYRCAAIKQTFSIFTFIVRLKLFHKLSKDYLNLLTFI